MTDELTKKAYLDFLRSDSTAKSNKPSSYSRALDIIADVLGKNPAVPAADVWAEESPERLFSLYLFLKGEQRKPDGGVFRDYAKSSYWKKNFCSAAVLAMAKFRAIGERDGTMMKLFGEAGTNGEELGRKLNAVRVRHERVFLDEQVEVASREGREALRMTKVRLNQDVFRRMLLAIYGGRCCVCGLNVPEVLRASHIAAWAKDKENQLNPSNGLCLSATYDAAFDQHLISFDEDYRMILAPSLKEYTTNEAFQTYFAAYAGKKLAMPSRFPPSQKLLAVHREMLA